MVDITSLKARLARLRLGSEFEDKNPELADPVTEERKKKKQKKAAQDPYNEYTTNTGGKRKKKNKLTRSDQKRGKKELRKKLDKVSEQSAIEEFEVGMDANKEVGCGINGCKYKITADQAKKQGLDSNNLWEHRYSHTD